MTNAVDTDVKIQLTASALTAYRECIDLIVNARHWATCADLQWDDIKDGKGEVIVEERQKKVDGMERSFYSNFARMITMSQGWKGENGISIQRDSEACFYWRHLDSTYEGGLIFHRDLSLSNPGEPLTIGTWGIHT